jgi:hypothetical protein
MVDFAVVAAGTALWHFQNPETAFAYRRQCLGALAGSLARGLLFYRLFGRYCSLYCFPTSSLCKRRQKLFLSLLFPVVWRQDCVSVGQGHSYPAPVQQKALAGFQDYSWRMSLTRQLCNIKRG